MKTRDIIGALNQTAIETSDDELNQSNQIQDSENIPYISAHAKRLRAAHANSHVKLYIVDNEGELVDPYNYDSDTETESFEDYSEPSSQRSSNSASADNLDLLADAEPKPIMISKPANTNKISDEIASVRAPITQLLNEYVTSREKNRTCLSFNRNIELTKEKVTIARNLSNLLLTIRKKDDLLQYIAIARKENKAKELSHSKEYYFFTSCGLMNVLDKLEELLNPKKALQATHEKKLARTEALQYMRIMR